MNLNRPNMTEDVKSKDYTNKFLQTGSNPVTMEASGIVVPCEFSVRNLKRFLTKLRTIPLPQNLLTRPKQPRTMPLFTAAVLMDTYAHTQDKPRLELAEKIEANFYTQDLTPAAPQPRQNEKPAATKISGKEILEVIRLMDAEERRELTRALFA